MLFTKVSPLGIYFAIV